MAISTVTATISAMPAASRKATKMRGSAAGMTIFAMRAPAAAAARAPPRSAAARRRDRGARQDQDRPQAGKGDDGDLHAIAEAERDQRDRQERDRGDRPDRLDGHFHQPVERRNTPRIMPSTRPMTPPIASPANAVTSVSRVAVRIEPSAKRSNERQDDRARRRQAVALQMGGARPRLRTPPAARAAAPAPWRESRRHCSAP